MELITNRYDLLKNVFRHTWSAEDAVKYNNIPVLRRRILSNNVVAEISLSTYPLTAILADQHRKIPLIFRQKVKYNLLYLAYMKGHMYIVSMLDDYVKQRMESEDGYQHFYMALVYNYIISLKMRNKMCYISQPLNIDFYQYCVSRCGYVDVEYKFCCTSSNDTLKELLFNYECYDDVKHLLDLGMNPLYSGNDYDGYPDMSGNLLFICLLRHNFELAEYVFQKCLKFDSACGTHIGHPMWEYALQNADFEIVKFLIKNNITLPERTYKDNLYEVDENMDSIVQYLHEKLGITSKVKKSYILYQKNDDT